MNEQSVKAYMDAYGMLPPAGGRVLAACSGGADSTALLHLLSRMDGVSVVCAHFNHCLRGAESDRDEAFVRDLCADLGVEFYAGRGDAAAYAKERKLSVEEAARELRYAFLERTAAEAGCARIATAHTADDNAETVLLHLIRGSGTRGLCGIPPVRDQKIIRPLLNVSRREILDYLAAHGLDHVEDSSNADENYTRNRVRRAVLPLLRELNPAAAEHINAAAALLREDEAYLDGLAREFIGEQYRNGSLPVPALLALPKPVAMRVLRTLCGSPGRAALEAVCALCEKPAPRAAADIPGLRVAREGDTLLFGPAPAPVPIARTALNPGETVLLPAAGKSVRCTVENDSKEIYRSFNTFFFQYEKICDKISVASRAAGDEVRLAGRGCTKSVRKLYAEAGLPPDERTRRLVFSDGAGVIAVEGFGVAERVAPEPGKSAVKIEILYGDEDKENV